jgi:hypothetical protein
MGGHGGLNILPQKKWNVYNRDNRLKVARDEAAHDQRQQDLAEKHNAAEREHRRKALKERARQRHGGAATINLDALYASAEPSRASLKDATEQDPTGYQFRQGAALPLDVATHGTDPMLSLKTTTAGEGTEGQPPPPPSKRQRKDKNQSKNQPAPSLAELALQLNNQAPPFVIKAPLAANETANRNSTAAPQPPNKHLNLFEEEETRAKNPDKAAEQRLLLSKRGDITTQTTDAKFDESFQLAYGFGGGSGKNGDSGGDINRGPWYVQHPSNSLIVAEDVSLIKKEEARWRAKSSGGGGGGVSMMERWKEEGRAALIAAGVSGNISDDAKEEDMVLLEGVRVIPKPEDVVEKEDKGKEKDRRKKEKWKEKGPYNRVSKKKEENMWRKLREERLRREQAEQKRQNEAVRSALLHDNSRGGGGGGRRYHSTYGYGK